MIITGPKRPEHRDQQRRRNQRSETTDRIGRAGTDPLDDETREGESDGLRREPRGEDGAYHPSPVCIFRGSLDDREAAYFVARIGATRDGAAEQDEREMRRSGHHEVADACAESIDHDGPGLEAARDAPAEQGSDDAPMPHEALIRP